jgi:hypothetical protein
VYAKAQPHQSNYPSSSPQLIRRSTLLPDRERATSGAAVSRPPDSPHVAAARRPMVPVAMARHRQRRVPQPGRPPLLIFVR